MAAPRKRWKPSVVVDDLSMSLRCRYGGTFRSQPNGALVHVCKDMSATGEMCSEGSREKGPSYLTQAKIDEERAQASGSRLLFVTLRRAQDGRHCNNTLIIINHTVV